MNGVFTLAPLFLLLMASMLHGAPVKQTLTIAVEEWPPLEYRENGMAKGVNIEVIRRIMKRLDVPVAFQFYPFARSWMLVQKGKVDAISNVSYQPNRDQALLYTDEQRAFYTTGKMPTNFLWPAEFSLFMRRRDEASVSFKSYSQKGIKDYTFGVVKDYSYDPAFRDADLRRKTYPSAELAFQAMANGEIDLFPMETTVGHYMLQKLGLSEKLKLYAGPPLLKKPYMLAFARHSLYPDIESLSRRFYVELAAMRESGEYDSIYESYIRPAYMKNLPHPLHFVCEEWVPWEYLEGEELKGVDVAVVDYIMKRLNLPYEISIYPWSRAWMLAQKGKADVVLSISYKDAREKVLYYTDDQRAFAQGGKQPENFLWMSEYVFFVMKNAASAWDFDSLAQLKRDGARVGRNRDYTYSPAFLEAEFEGPVYNRTEEGMLALTSGEIDLYPMDKTIGCAILERLGLRESVTYLPKPLFTKPYLSPFCRASDIPELEKIMDAFYRELRIMRSNGTYEKIYKESLEAIKKATTTTP